MKFVDTIHDCKPFILRPLGLRYVKPYSFTFTTYCKGRWLRRKLIDVLSQEFQSETADYYVRFE